MPKTDTLHIRVEPSVKKQAEETLNALGLSITEAVNIFLNQVIINEGIPFEIKISKNKTTLKAIEDVKNNKNLSKPYNSVDEAFKELDK